MYVSCMYVLGMWYLSQKKDDKDLCETSSSLLEFVEKPGNKDRHSVLNRCCVVGDYFKNKPMS